MAQTDPVLAPTAPAVPPAILTTAVAPGRQWTAGSSPARAGGESTRAFAATSLSFDEEIRRLLRHRLRVCGWACGVGIAGLLLVGLVDRSDMAGHGASLDLGLVCNAGMLAVIAGVLLALTRRPLSLPGLRAAELVLFGGLTAYGGVLRYDAFARLGIDPTEPAAARLAVERMAGVSNYLWYFVIIYYGVLIPNTRRRGLAVVAAIAAVPVATLVAAAGPNPGLREYLPVLLAMLGIGLFMSGGAAVFSAARVTSLQRQAFEARREAQQVGPYTLRRKLGEGGMGEVFLAEHRLLKRPCAVKFVRADLAADPLAGARFEREVRAMTALTSFHTVRVYDYGRADDGAFYYVMEYLDGPTLDRLVRDRGPLPPGRVVYLLRQLCAALAEAHAAGLVHRDIKPSNILVAALGGQRDVAKLLDFGLVQDHGAGADDGRLTRTGTVLGTPAYMCPEQAAGETGLDARGDLYSLGAAAFFALTGRPPFVATTVGRLLAAHLTEPPPSARAVRADVPDDLAAVIMRCLAKHPDDRYQTAADLDAALAGCGCAADWDAGRAAAWWAAAGQSTADQHGGDETHTAART